MIARAIRYGLLAATAALLSGCGEERQPDLEKLVRDGREPLRVADAYPEPWNFVCAGNEYQKGSAVVDQVFGPGYVGDFEQPIYGDHSALLLVNTDKRTFAVKMLSGSSRISISSSPSRTYDGLPNCPMRGKALLATGRSDPVWTHLVLTSAD